MHARRTKTDLPLSSILIMCDIINRSEKVTIFFPPRSPLPFHFFHISHGSYEWRGDSVERRKFLLYTRERERERERESNAYHCVRCYLMHSNNDTKHIFLPVNSGHNSVVRKSTESSVTAPDTLSFKTLRQKADEAVAGGYNLNLQKFERACGIPDRMLLPKGKHYGMEFGLVVMVSQDEHVDESLLKGNHAHCGINGRQYPDNRPMGFPLDRRINDERVFRETPNIKSVIVKVFHDDN